MEDKFELIEIIDSYSLKEWLWKHLVDMTVYEGVRVVRIDKLISEDYQYYIEDYINEIWSWRDNPDDEYPYALFIGEYKVDEYTEDSHSAYNQAKERLSYFMMD